MCTTVRYEVPSSWSAKRFDMSERRSMMSRMATSSRPVALAAHDPDVGSLSWKTLATKTASAALNDNKMGVILRHGLGK